MEGMMNSAPERPTILVMDDDEDVRFIAELMLQRMGFAVEFAENGAEAMTLYRQALVSGRRYHAVILDLNVPGGFGGREVIGQLKEIDPDITAFVACGNPYDPVVENPGSFGFKGAVTKPFLPENLQALLEQH